MTTTFTTAEVAKILKCDIQRVQILIRAGKLDAINIAVGSKKPRYRVLGDSLNSLLSPSGSSFPKTTVTPARKRQRLDAGVEKVFG